MNDNNLQNGQIPTTEELHREIRKLKRRLDLAETNLARARAINNAQDRVETILNKSFKKELQFFQLVLENSTNILLLFDFDGRFAYASNTFLRAAGIENFGLIIGRHYEEVFYPLLEDDTLARCTAALNTAIKQRKMVSVEEQLEFGQIGEIRTYSIFITPMFDRDTDVTELLGVMLLANDITEIKTTMEQMREADERTQMMLDATPLCCGLWDRNHKMIACNQEAVDLFGVSCKEEYIERFYEFSPELQPCGRKSHEKAMDFAEKAFKDGHYRFEWLHKKSDGELIPCDVFLVRMKYKDDYIIAGYIRDLREYKEMMAGIERRDDLLNTVNRMSAMLLRSEIETFESDLCQAMGIMACAVDVNRVSIWKNNIQGIGLHCQKMYGWTEGTCPVGVKEDAESFEYDGMGNWEEILAGNRCINGIVRDFSQAEYEYLSSRGIKSLLAAPVFIHNHFWGFVCFNDCTGERVFTENEERALRSASYAMVNAFISYEQNEKFEAAAHWYKSILDAIPLPLSVTDADMNWTYVNTATEKHLGMNREGILGLPCRNWGADICNTDECGIYCAKRGRMQTFFNEGETSYQVDTTILKNLQGETAGFIEVVQDVSNVQNLARQRAEAEAANHAKSAFLAMMSHEIRTPMNAILGITEIQKLNKSLPAETEDAFNKIHNSADILLHIINDLLDLSKIESGKFNLDVARYGVAGMLNDTVQLNMVRINGKPIEFKVDISENIPSVLLGDELRIKQILNNLLSNSFKYTDAGEVELKVSVERNNPGVAADFVIIIIVRDTGCGMTPEQLDILFDEYTRFNLEANRSVEGIGLGMSITKHLVNIMKGEIVVESEAGKGTTTTVRLPQGGTGSAPIGKEVADNIRAFRMHQAPPVKKARLIRKLMPAARVLVVDDVEVNLYVAKGLLAPYGMAVDTVMSGYEAIDRLSEGGVYDIVFMDHMMPKMDGIETTTKIRLMGYEAPVIALTANAVAGKKEMFMENGFNDFISKPIDVAELNNILEKWIPEEKQGPPEKISEKAEAEAKPDAGDYVNVKGLDTAKGISMTGGTAQGYVRALAMFYKESKSKINDIRMCLKTGDLLLYRTYIHALKSTTASIGSEDLPRGAEILELASQRGDVDFLVKNTDKFLAGLGILLYNINLSLSAKKEPHNTETLKTELSRLKTAMNEYDMTVVNEITASLQSFTETDETGGIVDKILQYQLIGEYDEAVLLIDGLLNE
ncbi:MAG: ATP-binding protein [Defluviitaleaceae bacterium]|nr:ATP-binding protein [Defluviitaleaceae bacterium]MCL2835367.1 ATP-binding protein [Defluviitaleaceae bacterium]